MWASDEWSCVSGVVCHEQWTALVGYKDCHANLMLKQLQHKTEQCLFSIKHLTHSSWLTTTGATLALASHTSTSPLSASWPLRRPPTSPSWWAWAPCVGPRSPYRTACACPWGRGVRAWGIQWRSCWGAGAGTARPGSSSPGSLAPGARWPPGRPVSI